MADAAGACLATVAGQCLVVCCDGCHYGGALLAGAYGTLAGVAAADVNLSHERVTNPSSIFRNVHLVEVPRTSVCVDGAVPPCLYRGWLYHLLYH